MSFITQNLLPRLKRLLRFYRQLIGLRRTAAMMFSSLVVSILELGGFALLFPFIRLVTDVEFFQGLSHRVEGTVFAGFFQTHFSAVVISGAGLGAYFVIKAVLYTVLIRYQARVAGDVNALSTKHLIDAALNSRFQLFQDEGAVKIAGVSYSNTAHAALLFQSLVAAGNEFIFLVIVFCSLVVVAPGIMLGVVGVSLVLAFGIFLPLSRQVGRIGRSTRDLEYMRHRFVYAMISAIRDIKIMGLEPMFAKRNAEIVEGHATLYAQYQTISSSLRVLVETLMLCAIVATGVWFVASGANLAEVAPLLATLGLIAVRTAPALSKLVGYYNNFRLSLPLVEALLDTYEIVRRYAQPKHEDGISFKGDYSARGLRFGYGANLVIDDASIVIPQGKVVAIVGASGSGKSTLLDLLAGLQRPLEGEFSIGGKVFEPFKSLDFSRNIGYIPQSITLLDATLEFNICLEEHPDPVRLEAAIKKAHLNRLIDSLPQGLKTFLGEGGGGLSGGQRQRVGIARALYRNPVLLILDEVTSALDEVTARAVMQDLHALRGETSLLFVSHDMRVIDADYQFEMVDGHLIETHVIRNVSP